MENTSKSLFINPAADFMRLTQTVLSLNPVMSPQTQHFWKAQDQILKETEYFVSAWFLRRHDATHAAMDISSHIDDGKQYDPAYIMTVISDWQAQSMKRMSDDAGQYSDMITRCLDSLVDNEAQAVEETISQSKRLAKQQDLVPA